MIKDKFILTITGGYTKEFDHYPIDHEIIEFIKTYYPHGIGYYRIGGSVLLKPTHESESAYNVEAKVDKVMVYNG